MRPLILTGAVVLALAVGAAGDESIIHSKHDLSVFGPGSVRATDETQVCVFCHTPHNASPAAPLWNRYNPTRHYRVYRSESLDARVAQPGPASRQCLSCHDGTIALGLTLDRPATDPRHMTQPYLPTGASNLTTDLSDDHPIGFRYDRAVSNRDAQVRPPQLVDHRIQLGPRGEVECTACHDAHNNELGKFLRVTDQRGALCTTCHDMRGWQASSHRVSPRSEPLAAAGGERPRYQSIADNACAACHKSHGAPERERLLNDHPSQLCTDCHDGTTARNILSAMNQRSGHRFNAFGHQRRDPTDRLRITQAVECTDCHNPHAAGPDVLVGGRGPGWPDPTVPPAMREVPGVTAGGVEVPRARLYYEVCFRCHADNPVRVRDRIQRESDSGGNIRRELLPTAASAHPIVFAARNTADVPSLLPTLRQRRYIGCQDCHDNPDGRSAGGAEAAGPHGSRFDHLLVARYETADQTLESPQTYALCYQCHDRTSILANESFTLHRNHVVRDRTPCSACHAPHGVSGSGSEHDHLINFDLAIVSGRRFYQDTGRFSGTCTLRCHGVEHVNFIYGNP